MADTHVPFHDIRAIGATLNFVSDIKPDRLVHLGDYFDFPEFSRHTKKMAGQKPTFQQSQDEGLKLMEFIASAYHLDTLCEGNHDAHPERWIANIAPEFTGCHALAVPRMLQLRKHRVHWVTIDEQRDFMVGPVNAHHGFAVGKNHINKSLQDNPRPQVYAHTHKEGIGTGMRFGGDAPRAMSVGCLRDLWPDWKRGRPSDWTQSVGSVWWENGTVLEMQVHQISNGVLTANGKRYKG